jgi:chaperone required for assembly of F1-ATPase
MMHRTGKMRGDDKRPAGPKRLYKIAQASAMEDGFTVRLDDRPVRTPARAKLIVPTLALAQGLADEWNEQGEHVIPQIMPLNRMAQSAIDLISKNLDGVTADLATYAGTDLLCYRAETPADLVRRQAETWQPWLDWAAEVYGARLVVTEGVIAVRQSQVALDRMKAAVRAYDHFRLAALQQAVTITGSLVLGLALARGALDAEVASRAAELDESYQIDRWGDDPEAANRRTRARRDLAAADRFFRALGD